MSKIYETLINKLKIKGVHPKTYKTLSNKDGKSFTPPIFEEYAISLLQRDGELAIPTVNVGDYVKAGDIIAKPSSDMAVYRHAPTSGIIRSISKNLFALHPAKKRGKAIVITSDKKDEHSLLEPLKNYFKLDKHILLNRIKESGISGMGGAGFPTEKKINLKRNVNTLIINGAECEPYLTCDDILMREKAKDILEGARIIAYIIGAKEILVGIESDKKEAIKSMNDALDFLGDSRIKIKTLPTKYPIGSRQQLAKFLLNKETRVGKRSYCYDFICHNVATAKTCYDAVFLGKTSIERYVTLSSDSKDKSKVVKARVGTFIYDILNYAGTLDDEIVVGGTMMGFSIDCKEAKEMSIKRETTALLTPKRLIKKAKDRNEQPCIRCNKCVEVCPINLLPQQLFFYLKNNNFDKASEYRLMDCIDCGCCSYVCPSDIPLVRYFQYGKGNLKKQKIEKKLSDRAKLRHDNRILRLENEALEKAKKLEEKKKVLLKKQTENDSDCKTKEEDIIAAALKRVNEKKKNI